MCSIPGLPSPGSNVNVLITRVHLNPLCVLVEFWGNFDKERKPAYQRMRKEIQFPVKRFQELEGEPGDLCLVKVFETWYRARVVSRNALNYSVFLIDEGKTLNATTGILAWGSKDYFHLPPEVEFCVLANVLPVSPENKWSPMAFEFLKSLSGKTVDGCVQDLLVPHRTFLLDIPSVSRQMYEMGFAKKLSNENFKLFVGQFLLSPSGAVLSSDSQATPLRTDPLVTDLSTDKAHRFLYPELQAETVESVVVTEVTNPLRIFCQLKVFSQELKKLTEHITQYYEGRVGMGKIKLETLGFPCAARGNDGKWYRSVLLQVLSSNTVVEVLHVDYGKKDFVQVDNIKPLVSEFFRMPVVTYVCSLQGIIDRGVGWTAAQIDYLKSLLLHHTLIAKFEYQSVSEGVHYVTLFGEDNVNINQLFGMKEVCLLEPEKVSTEFVCKRVDLQTSHISASKEACQGAINPLGAHEVIPLLTEELPLHTSHMAVVQFVNNPSEFWIQTQRYSDEFDSLMQGISDLYDHSGSAATFRNLSVGLFCAARSQDNAFYRAIVREVMDKQSKVYFVDYGNTEVVNISDIRVLPEKYQQLPALALKCGLGAVRPKGGKWSENSTTFFTRAVENRVLDIHVSACSQNKYIVQLTDTFADGEKNIATLLCSAGMAEKDEIRKPVSRPDRKDLLLPAAQVQVGKCSDATRSGNAEPPDPSTRVTAVTEPRTAFKEHLFPIGSSVDVQVSYIESPNDFWCQTSKNSWSLKLLMQDIQNYYSNSEPQQLVDAACVARHPDSGMWYRALIIYRPSPQDADVLFIDYGQTLKVSVNDLRPINPTFLKLKGQAFRCSLYNLIHPMDSPTGLEWSEAAIAEFRNFVESATSSLVSLKCTIYALMYDSQGVVFNVVDLETPFQSICTLLVQKGLAKRALPKKSPQPPFRLDTYYYSTHNIKTGGEEMVRVISVKSVHHFYCQLERNSEALQKLSEKVNYFCRQLQYVKCPQTFGTVCFAKYTDGHWYRGQIKSTHPTIQVHFVDYGDTLEMDKSDLLPIPIEAGEIMSVPVQAVECGLCDIPEDVSSDVNGWFERNATDLCYKALIVAKEPNGKVMVELYDGKTQLNATIKARFPVYTRRKEGASFEDQLDHIQDLPAHTSMTFTKVYSQPRPKQIMENKYKLDRRIPTAKFESAAKLQYGKTMHKDPQSMNKDDVHKRPVGRQIHHCGQGDAFGKGESYPMLTDLPSKSLRSGCVAEVFISHVTSPSHFCVQLTEDEDLICKVVEKMNTNPAAPTGISSEKLQEGHLLNAVFSEDGSWYRGVIRNASGGSSVTVEFIDFGNTTDVSCYEISSFNIEWLAVPRLSIPCLLSGYPHRNADEWVQEDIAKFRAVVGENGSKRFMCTFIKQMGSDWEVSLENQGRDVAGMLFSSSLDGGESLELDLEHTGHDSYSGRTEGTEIGVTLVSYKQPKVSEGQSFEVYASCIDGPQYFWCQFAHTDELQKITEAAGKFGSSSVLETSWMSSLKPGSPCLALFVEDEQWYRAEVIRRTDNVVCTLFVDYGNESEIALDKVRPVPSSLMEVPLQALLCQLDDFDPSHGSWGDGATNQFIRLITDELLSITVNKVECYEDQNPICWVRVEVKGQIVNDKMKSFWKLFCASESEQDPHINSVGKTPLPVSESQLFEQNVIFSTVEQNLHDNLSEDHKEWNSKDANLLPVKEQDFFHEEEGANDLQDASLLLLSEVEIDKTLCMDKEETQDKEKFSEEVITISPANAKLPDLPGPSFASPEDEKSAIEVNCESASLIEKAVIKSLSPEVLVHEDHSTHTCEAQNFTLVEEMDEVYMLEQESVPPEQKTCPVKEVNLGFQLDEQQKQDTCDEVIKEICEKLQAVVSIPSSSDESSMDHSMDDQDSSPLSQFGQLEKPKFRPCVGLECIVWSYQNNAWCRAKIVRVFDDSAKVVFVDYDGEALLDLENIFQIISQDQFTKELAAETSNLDVHYETPQDASEYPSADCRSQDTAVCCEVAVGHQKVTNETVDKADELSLGTVAEEMVIADLQLNNIELSTVSEETSGLDVHEDSQNVNQIDREIEDGASPTSEPATEQMPLLKPEIDHEERLDEQLPRVKHSTLKIEDVSDDPVIFVKETRIPPHNMQGICGDKDGR